MDSLGLATGVFSNEIYAMIVAMPLFTSVVAPAPRCGHPSAQLGRWAMRAVSVVALAFVYGCSATVPISSTSSPDNASLSLRDAGGKPFAELDGIWRVDAYQLKTPRARINIAAGEHRVGYQCPGTTSWDDWASLQYHFEAGRSYEMICEPNGDVVQAVVRLLPR